jgi:hypothetical protein
VRARRGYRGELGSITHAEFGVHVREMRLHRSAAHEQARAHLEVVESVDHQLDHFQLGGREAVPTRGWALARTPAAAHVRDRLLQRKLGTFSPGLVDHTLVRWTGRLWGLMVQ